MRAARLEGGETVCRAASRRTGADAGAARPRRLAISVRQLHLLFEPTGTSFAQHVSRRRLCGAAPGGPRQSDQAFGDPIADIAFGWGFSSIATFYRAFEREFGMPPAALRAVETDHAD